MKIFVPAETLAGEPRVAISLDTVKKFTQLGCAVSIETNAGKGAHISDEAFTEAGAKIVKTTKQAAKEANIILKVLRPTPEEAKSYKKGAVVVGILDPYSDMAGLKALAKAGVSAFAMELMPRITRAQSMDVLSSQSNLAGYKAVIDAAAEFDRAMPMMMTAAGTIAPARVFVMGAGVAGLQAIATARRLGAIVSATDVRAVAAEQVESLGATFVMVESDDEDGGQTAGGYAKEMSDDYKRRQAELVAETIKKQDIVICTALIPGRPAPTLVSKEMVESMKPGSIVVDLAVERGGNCPLSKPGKVIVHKDVTIMGHVNVAGRLAVDASNLYARNLFNFLAPMFDSDSGKFNIDWEDETVTGTGLMRDGKMIHPLLSDSDKE